MARPIKSGFDYFPFDVGFFRNLKIRVTLMRFGAGGVLLYLYLLTLIYSQGYYTEYNEDMLYIAADDLQMKPEKIGQIINFFCKRSLFDNKLFTTDKIITSAGIQKRYQLMIKQRALKKTVSVNERFWLLEKEETETFIKLHSSGNKSGKNEGYSEKKPDKSENNSTKESKVKESKVKESKVCTSGFSIPCKNGTYVLPKEDYENLTHTYPDMDVDKSLDKLRKYLTANPHKQGYVSAAKAYVDMWLCEDDQTGKYRKECSVIKPAYDLHEYEDSGMLGPEWDDIG